MVGYKKSFSVIYAHFKEKRISQSMDILARDGEPKSRRPKSKSTTSFSRNTDLSKSKSTNRCVTFTGILRRGIARRHASDQSWLKISRDCPLTLEHQGLRNSRNRSRNYRERAYYQDIGAKECGVSRGKRAQPDRAPIIWASGAWERRRRS